MSDLTEQLKAGELYYVKKKNGEIVIRQAHLYSCLRTENATPFVDFDDNDIEKVLAPVPSYDELQSLEADRLAKNEGEEIVAELKEENARLKSERDKFVYDLGVADATNWALLRLLKECVVIIGYADTISNNEENKKTIHELLTKIKKVLK